MPTDQPPLPSYKHLPGVNPRPTDALLESIAQQAHPITIDSNTHDNIGWQYGIRLINAGFYWEAHEVLEEVWKRAPQNSRERFLTQCLIHIANAALKRVQNKPRAAERLCNLAEQCRQRAFTKQTQTLMGFDAEQIKAAISQCWQFEGSIVLRGQKPQI